MRRSAGARARGEQGRATAVARCVHLPVPAGMACQLWTSPFLVNCLAACSSTPLRKCCFGHRSVCVPTKSLTH